MYLKAVDWFAEGWRSKLRKMSRSQGGKESVHPRGGISGPPGSLCLDNIAGTLVTPCADSCCHVRGPVNLMLLCFFLSLTLTAFSLMKLRSHTHATTARKPGEDCLPMTYRRKEALFHSVRSPNTMSCAISLNRRALGHSAGRITLIFSPDCNVIITSI